MDGLVVVALQSLATTVLSRTHRREETIDDGTFTIIRPHAIEDVWQHCDVDEAVDREQTCLLVRFALKRRIRDLKRIFSFYASGSNSGSSERMDHAEWWYVSTPPPSPSARPYCPVY